MSIKVAIEAWFNRTGGGSMILPDGWFGRPYDNIHVLKGIHESEHGLKMDLSDQISLTFVGFFIVAEDLGDRLTIGPFASLSLEARSSERVLKNEYGPSSIQFVAHPG
jgi:hypothetical protein